MAARSPVEEKRLPADNDNVTMDFVGFDEKGEAVPGVSGEAFVLSLGENQVIPDFEALARTVALGDSGEGVVKFPDDYGNKDLAGKAVTVKITVKALEQRILPEVDDEFAKKAGGFDSVAAMRDSVRASYMRSRADMAKAKAQSILLESLLQKTSFPLPEGMVDRYARNIMRERLENLARQGRDVEALPEAEQEGIKAGSVKEAEQYAKTQLFLLTVARKEKLAVSSQEMTAALRQIAMRGGRDVKEVQEQYIRNNLLPALRDRLLADKAMDAIYDAAAGARENAPEGGERKPPETAAEKADTGDQSATE
jgi:trigger factor